MQIYNFNDHLINKKYKISQQINKGSFGLIFKAHDLESESDVAVKIEKFGTSKKYLLKEARILHKLQKSLHIPRIYWCGDKADTTFLVMELLGKNLDDLFKECNKKFHLKTVLMLADQMLANLEFIHSLGYVHCDINPRNICVGLGGKARVFYFIDFGLSTSYRKLQPDDNLKAKYPFVGTLNFSSINIHKGFERTCLDDIESFFYMMIYFLNGKLPWEDIANGKGDTRKRIQDIKNEKINLDINVVCVDWPLEIVECFKYFKGLEFHMKPDYNYMRKQFQEVYLKKFGSFDYKYDWSDLEVGQKEEEIPKKTNKKNKFFDDHYKEEQKQVEKCKKNEEDNVTRRKNSFIPNQIYQIKKKVKINESINLLEKPSINKTSEKVQIQKEKSSEEKPEKINENLQEKTKENSQENETKAAVPLENLQENSENKALKANVKERFDLLYGIDNSMKTLQEKYPENKGYCRLF